MGNIPKSYTDFLQLSGLRGARIGLLTDLFGSEPEDAEVAKIVRVATNEMNGQGAEVVEVTIPGVNKHMADNTVLRSDVKFDLNAYLASRPSAPVRTLEEILASGKYTQSGGNEPTQLTGSRVEGHERLPTAPDQCAALCGTQF